MNLNKDELFYQDNKLFEFTSYVVACFDYGDRFGIVLNKTGFFPEAGGQSADKGVLNGVEVLDVQVTANGIEHYMKTPIEVGSVVTGVLDKNERLKKERNHTGEHIISSVVHKMFGYDNVGFHMGEKGMDVDFNGSFTADDLYKIELEANSIVQQNVLVKTYFPTQQELQNISYRSKLELDSPRIVEIVGYDYCACCAPHVTQTGEIGLIKIVDSYKNRGNTRLTLLCQQDAVEYVLSVTRDAGLSAQMLSSKPYSVSAALKKQLENSENLSKECSNLKRQMTQMVLNSMQPTTDYLVVFAPQYMAKDVVNKGIDLTPKGVCVFSELGDTLCYMIASSTNDMRPLSQKLNMLFDGKGGGKPCAVQGRIKANTKQIEEFFKAEK